MAYDEGLADRVREQLSLHPDLTERKMFGGIAFMLGGNMAVGVTGDRLMVRLGPEETPLALREPHVIPMDFTGRPLNGFVFVEPEGIAAPEQLAGWVEAGAGFAQSLAPK